MITLAGIIITDLYLSTSSTFHKCDSYFLCMKYIILDGVVYLTMLCLGERSTYMPLGGSFC